MKRPLDDDTFSLLSYKSSLLSDQLTPPADKRRFRNDFPVYPSHNSVQLSLSQQSLSSPPPSPVPPERQNDDRPSPNETSTQISDQSDEWELIAEPPRGVSPDEYHKAIPTNVSQRLRMAQLLLWSAQEAKKKNSGLTPNIEDRKAEQIAGRIQGQLLQKLREGKIVPSWYAHLSGPSSTLAKTPNPRNEANRRRIQDFKAVLKSLYEEEQEWRDATSQLFSEHAAMLDSSSKENIPTPITLDLLDSLDDGQKQFAEAFCQDDNDVTIQERVDFEEMEAEVTDLRQKLSVVSHFQSGAERYCKETMNAIARERERESCIPSERAKFAHIVDQDKALREARKDTAKSVLQALSNLNNKEP